MSASRRVASGARTSRLIQTRSGITFAPPGATSTFPTGRNRVLDRKRRIADAEDLRRGGDERIVAALHRRRSRVACMSLDDELPARITDDPRHDAERDPALGEHRALLDMELEKRARQLTASRDERPAADASDLLTAERDHRAATRALDGLDRADHAERAVEPPTLGHRVQVRADPDVVTFARAAEEVAVRVHLDDEPCLLEPACGELVRLVLGGAWMRSVGTRPVTDRVELLEALVNPHGHQTRST